MWTAARTQSRCARSRKHGHEPLPTVFFQKAARSTFFKFHFFSWDPRMERGSPRIQSQRL